MKIIIYILITIILISYVNAQGLGNCALGNYPLGDCTITPTPTTTTGGGGGTGTSGTTTNENLILQITGLFANFTLNLFKTWFGNENPQLEYRLITPTDAKQGEIIQITNLFTNEGVTDTEVHCINFLDINRNGEIDYNEPQEKFSKEATKKIQNSVQTTIRIPADTPLGDYLIGGKCKLLNSNMPNATAGNKIKVLSNIFNTSIPSRLSTIMDKITTERVVWGLIAILGIFVLFKSGLWVLLIGWLQTLATLLVAMGMAGLLLVIVVLIYLYFKYWR